MCFSKIKRTNEQTNEQTFIYFCMTCGSLSKLCSLIEHSNSSHNFVCVYFVYLLIHHCSEAITFDRIKFEVVIKNKLRNITRNGNIIDCCCCLDSSNIWFQQSIRYDIRLLACGYIWPHIVLFLSLLLLLSLFLQSTWKS